MHDAIPFLQYIRPNGIEREIVIERPSCIVQKAEQIIEAGYRFEIEEWYSGMIHLTITHNGVDVAREMIRNDFGCNMGCVVDRLVLRFIATGQANVKEKSTPCSCKLKQ